MKKILAAFAASAMLALAPLTAFASGLIPNEYYISNTVPVVSQKPLLVDDADILSDSEEDKLLEKLESISDQYDIDVILLTTYSLGDRGVQEFADDYFAYNGMGQGEDKDGFMLMLSMEERDWAICTHGKGIDILTDRGQEFMIDQIKPDLSINNYYDAFDRYADLSEDYIKEWQKGTPYDSGHMPKGKLPLIWIPIALGSGALIGLIRSQMVKSQLTSVSMQSLADDYIRRDSFKLNVQRDTFLYKNVSRTKIESSSSSGRSGRSGGGSSTHYHSSGSSFGGSHGKF